MFFERRVPCVSAAGRGCERGSSDLRSARVRDGSPRDLADRRSVGFHVELFFVVFLRVLFFFSLWQRSTKRTTRVMSVYEKGPNS